MRILRIGLNGRQWLWIGLFISAGAVSLTGTLYVQTPIAVNQSPPKSPAKFVKNHNLIRNLIHAYI